MSKIIFCTNKDDIRGLIAIKALQQVGCSTVILKAGEKASEIAVAFFTPKEESNINWGKWLKMTTHRFGNIVPDWAKSTPYSVALRPNPREEPSKDPAALTRFQKAVLSAALKYEVWFTENVECPPWGQKMYYTTKHIKELENWRSKVTFPTEKVEKTYQLHHEEKNKPREKYRRYRRHRRINSLLINFKDGLS
ncbi:MAG TPA: hypothetical protein ENH90_01175 [bacterium]|nr:hypothetical protein [bacterium]